MTIRFVLGSAFAVGAIAALPAPALAQAGWTPASEIVGQPVQVTTNGVTNTVYLDAGGTARILTPAGRAVPANWTASGGQLCLSSGAAQECWPYRAPFQPGAAVTATSSCNATSTWLAAATNAPPPVSRGERGR